MKKAGALALVFLLLIASLPAIGAAESEPVTVTVDGQTIAFDQAPIIENDRVLVPLRAIFEALGASVEWNEWKRTVTAVRGETSVSLEVDSSFAQVNGQDVLLEAKSRIVNGRTLIPLRFVSEALSAQVEWNEATRSVSITSPARAERDEAPDPSALDLADAQEQAIANSIALKNVENDIEKAKEQLEKASDNVIYVPTDSGNPAAVGAYVSYTQAEIAYQMAYKQLDITKDSVEYAAAQAYRAVLQAKERLKLAQEQLDLAQLQRDLTQVRYEVGLASEAQLTQARNQYQSAAAAYEANAKALADAYEKLNQLLGLPLDARPALVDWPVLKDTSGLNLESHVNQVLNNSAVVWMAEQQVNLADLRLDLYVYNDPTSMDTYRTREIDVQKAVNSVSSTKDQLEEFVRGTYNNIKVMEEQYQVLQQNLQNAIENLRLVEARYDAGMATKYDWMSAKLNVAQIKQQMFDIAAQQNNLLMAYEKPWVVTGGSAQ